MTEETKQEAKDVLDHAKKNALAQVQLAAETAKQIIEVARTEASRATEAANHLIETARIEATKVLGIAAQAQAQAQAQGQGQGQGQVNGRFIDLSRVPLICQSIIGIHGSLDEIKRTMLSNNEEFKKSNVTQDQFQPVKVIAYGLVGTILLGVVGAILAMVLRSPTV